MPAITMSVGKSVPFQQPCPHHHRRNVPMSDRSKVVETTATRGKPKERDPGCLRPPQNLVARCMVRRLLPLVVVGAVLLVHVEASAQHRTAPLFPPTHVPSLAIGPLGLQSTPSASDPARQPSSGRLVAGGLLGAATGVALGFAVGPSLIETGCERGEVCSGAEWVQNGAFGGVYLFTTFLTPYGVHRANDRAGSYWWDLLASFGGGGVAMTMVFLAGTPGLVALVPAQIGAAYLAERANSR